MLVNIVLKKRFILTCHDCQVWFDNLVDFCEQNSTRNQLTFSKPKIKDKSLSQNIKFMDVGNMKGISTCS